MNETNNEKKSTNSGSSSQEVDTSSMGQDGFASAGTYYGLVYQIGFTIIISMGIFGFIGYLIDKRLGIKGVFMIVGIIIGAVGGMHSIYKTIMGLDYDRKQR